MRRKARGWPAQIGRIREKQAGEGGPAPQVSGQRWPWARGGNLFPVFWLDNMAGSRDVLSPDGDTKFFTWRLGELPREPLSEVRRRNSQYIVWLASHLPG